MPTKPCAHCNELFPASSSGRKYCSDSCKKSGRPSRPVRQDIWLICSVCKTPYQGWPDKNNCCSHNCRDVFLGKVGAVRKRKDGTFTYDDNTFMVLDCRPTTCEVATFENQKRKKYNGTRRWFLVGQPVYEIKGCDVVLLNSIVCTIKGRSGYRGDGNGSRAGRRPSRIVIVDRGGWQFVHIILSQHFERGGRAALLDKKWYDADAEEIGWKVLRGEIDVDKDYCSWSVERVHNILMEHYQLEEEWGWK